MTQPGKPQDTRTKAGTADPKVSDPTRPHTRNDTESKAGGKESHGIPDGLHQVQNDSGEDDASGEAEAKGTPTSDREGMETAVARQKTPRRS